MVQVQEKFYGREVILADRDMVEQNSGDHQKFNICNFSFIGRWYNFYFLFLTDEILSGADQCDVAFLVVGDPFGYVI